MAIKIRVDAKKMEDLLRNFYLITGIRIVVFDDNFEKIAEYPGNHCGYCKIVRKESLRILQNRTKRSECEGTV